MCPAVISDGDVVIAANEPQRYGPGAAPLDSGGDIVFKTRTVERLRIKNNGDLVFKSGVAVTDYQAGAWTVPADSPVFSVDRRGNVLVGPNELLATLDGSDSRFVADFGISADKRRPYFRQLVLTEVGNPTNIYLRCAGGTWPLGPPAQLPVDAGIGSIRWMPMTDQLDFQGQTAQIASRTMELPTHSACGGDLRFMTTPIGQSQPVTAVVVDHDGTLMLGSNKDTWMRRHSTDLIKLANAADSENGALWAPSGLISKTKAGALTDGDFRAAMLRDGLFGFNTLNNRLEVRLGGTWKTVALT